MRRIRASLILLFGMVITSGCVVQSSRDVVPPPRVELLGVGGPASQYGTQARQIFDHPALRTKVRALFGPDWESASRIGLTSPAPAYFERSSPPTRLRMDNVDWIAVRGCVPSACATRHGLVLIAPGSDRLFARIDDGGFSRVYGYGPGMANLGGRDRALVNAAWQAAMLSTAESG